MRAGVFFYKTSLISYGAGCADTELSSLVVYNHALFYTRIFLYVFYMLFYIQQ